jgi:hypothetical protein
MVFNATFNNISVISWLSVLLVEKNGVPGENHSAIFQLYHGENKLIFNGHIILIPNQSVFALSP